MVQAAGVFGGVGTFTVSCPSKVVLSGEHSVVVARNAVAMAINKRSIATVTSYVDEKCRACDCSDCTFSVSLHASNIQIPCLCESVAKDIEHRENLSAKILKCIRLCMEDCHFKSIRSPDQRIEIDLSMATIIGSGLGSSASISCMLASIFLVLSRKITCQVNGDTDLRLINELSFKCECLFHEKPSGMDNTTIVYGGVQMFSANHDSEGGLYTLSNGISFNRLPERSFSAFMVYCGKSKDTKRIQTTIKHKFQHNQEALQTIYRNINEKVIEVKQFLQSGMQDVPKLSSLLYQNMELLRGLDVSCDEVEDILALGTKFSLHGKLSGAGAGGFVFFLYDPNCGDQVKRIVQLQNYLARHSMYEVFTCFTESTGVSISLR